MSGNSISIGDHLLGRIVNHDPRSRNFPAPVRRMVRPNSKTHTLAVPALNQGDIGSCVGHTAAQWLNCAIAKPNRMRGHLPTPRRSRLKFNRSTRFDDDDAREIYSAATTFDPFDGSWPPVDTGSSGLGGVKSLQKYGFIDSYTHVFDFSTLCSVVIAQPVMLGINWYSGMFDPDSNGLIRPTGSLSGGHEILIRGIDFGKKLFRLRNHWTPEWGIKGDCFISFGDMQRLLSEEGDVTVPTVARPFNSTARI